MKDRQGPITNAAPRIPVISAVLHCFSMPLIVCMRSSFGYAYLRPKSIFFAFSWAVILFTIYSWLQPGAWQKNAATCLFGLGASLLYFIHLGVAVAKEIRGDATHDHDSGLPHSFRILHWLGAQPSARIQSAWVIWGEPAIALFAALGAYLVGVKNLSAWLALSAVCLWCKETLNFWLQLRQRKRQRDAVDDASESFDASSSADIPVPAASRKSKMSRQRTG